MKFLNLACGDTFINSSEWVNVDFNSTYDQVLKVNLLTDLPFRDSSFDLVYSSHFLEHIPIRLVPGFLSECNRVLRPGGTIRLVTPDSEEMFSTYLQFRRNNQNQEADFLMLEIIDQCVRREPGGELGRFISSVNSMEKEKQEYWQDFIRGRIGDISVINDAHPSSKKQRSLSGFRRAEHQVYYLVRKYINGARQIFHDLGLSLLKESFRNQNVSMASIGENHCWLWDYYQLREFLVEAGFVCVTKVNHYTSSVRSFPCLSLDSAPDGSPRKGLQSMFVEGVSC
jgi:SAM-dependent methyltransferase